MLDQASGLRRLLGRRTVRVLPIIGGAECTWLAAMLSTALTRMGERVLLLDQGEPSCARYVGSETLCSLDDFVAGRCDYEDAVCSAASGIQLAVLGDPQTGFLAQGVTTGQLLSVFLHAPEPVDLVVIRSSHPAAIARLIDIESEILLTTTADPASIRSAYLNIKRTCARAHRYQLVVVGNADAPDAVHSKIASAAARFLGIAPSYGGDVPAPAAETDGGATPMITAAFTRLAALVRAWRLAEYPSGASHLLASPH